ncbi:hypothetical protein [Desulfobacca acetoxidans]|uniref:Uncharacterized protein n=1 Tax=Desulfobacca acetoxidans (strain ATCC 700848 / DSM 11109 / ASRB2) TaxID=880072 RepID=F2NHG3_DESAR|nr:hypothetical protein [Desulfobacca acetoxidans]AEB09079.1 hypothetical protein Desac_1218 [Desulfobacca acetoxidans DSM 11109]
MRRRIDQPQKRDKNRVNRESGIQSSRMATATAVISPHSRKILLVSDGEKFDRAATEYALNVAQRLNNDIIAMNVCPSLAPLKNRFSPFRLSRQELFKRRAASGFTDLQRQAAAKGVQCWHLINFGELNQAVEELNQEVKRIEFVITGAETGDEKGTEAVTLPMFLITGKKGDMVMAKQNASRRKNLIQVVGFGALSAVMYAAVFLNTDTVMKYFTRGAWYAALPIITVFAVSFVHGAFANYFWSALGIEAPKQTVQPTAAKRPVARKRPRPELRLNA